jgi:hypothetical protein
MFYSFTLQILTIKAIKASKIGVVLFLEAGLIEDGM